MKMIINGVRMDSWQQENEEYIVIIGWSGVLIYQHSGACLDEKNVNSFVGVCV